MKPLHPETMTWSVLLAHWMDFARASVAIAKLEDGPAWQASVVPIITLQAVTFALADLESLPEADHPFAIDRAGVLVREACSGLEVAWPGGAPESVVEIVGDARVALAAVRGGG